MLLLAIGALAVAAIVNAVQHGGRGATAPPLPATHARPTLEGSARAKPFLPRFVLLPSELRREGGVLWLVSPSCQAGWIDVGLGRTAELPGRHCRLWPAPTGDRAILVTARRAAALAGRGLIEVRRSGGAERLVRHTPGFLGAELAWSPDGAVAAACFGGERGPVLDLLYADRARALRGLCAPAFTGSGRLAAAVPSPPRVVVGGRLVLSPAQAASLLRGAPARAATVVSALAAGGGRIAVGLTAVTRRSYVPATAALAVLSGGGRLLLALPLGRALPSAIGLAPDGTALWYLNALDGTAHLVGLPAGRALPAPAARRYAWSPSGRYLAAATDDGLLVRAWPSGQQVARLPLAVSDLGWSAG